MIKEIQNKAKDLIANGELSKAIELTGEFVKRVNDESLIDFHVSISSDYFQVRSGEIRGIVDIQQQYLFENKIKNRLLKLIKLFSKLDEDEIQRQNRGIVPASYYQNHNTIYQIISQLIISDENINNIKLSIEDKKIEILKSKNSDEISFLKSEIDALKKRFEDEVLNYETLKDEYNIFKTEYYQFKIDTQQNFDNAVFEDGEDYSFQFLDMKNQIGELEKLVSKMGNALNEKSEKDEELSKRQLMMFEQNQHKSMEMSEYQVEKQQKLLEYVLEKQEKMFSMLMERMDKLEHIIYERLR